MSLICGDALPIKVSIYVWMYLSKKSVSVPIFEYVYDMRLNVSQIFFKNTAHWKTCAPYNLSPLVYYC